MAFRTQDPANVVVIDVRTEFEFYEGHLMNAYNIPLGPSIRSYEHLTKNSKFQNDDSIKRLLKLYALWKRSNFSFSLFFHCEFSQSRAPMAHKIMITLYRKDIPAVQPDIVPRLYIIKYGYEQIRKSFEGREAGNIARGLITMTNYYLSQKDDNHPEDFKALKYSAGLLIRYMAYKAGENLPNTPYFQEFMRYTTANNTRVDEFIGTSNISQLISYIWPSKVSRDQAHHPLPEPTPGPLISPIQPPSQRRRLLSPIHTSDTSMSESFDAVPMMLDRSMDTSSTNVDWNFMFPQTE